MSANSRRIDVSWASSLSHIWLHQHSEELRLFGAGAGAPPPLLPESLLLMALGAAATDFLEPRVSRSSSAAASFRTEAAFTEKFGELVTKRTKLNLG